MREKLESTQRDLEASRAIRGELATKLANATTDQKLAEERLEAERVRADRLIKQIEEKEQAIANLKTQLEQLQSEKLENLGEQTVISHQSSVISDLQNELETRTGIEAIKLSDIEETIKKWKSISKNTRDWTKCNQLLEELQPEKLEILEEQPPAVETEQPTVTSQQLTLNLEPEPVNPEPSIDANQAAPMNPEPETETSQESSANGDWVEVGRKDLMEYIYNRYPEAKPEPEPENTTEDNTLVSEIELSTAEGKMKAQNITDAINGKKSKRLPEFEEKYKFKHIGKKGGQHRFLIPETY